MKQIRIPITAFKTDAGFEICSVFWIFRYFNETKETESNLNWPELTKELTSQFKLKYGETEYFNSGFILDYHKLNTLLQKTITKFRRMLECEIPTATFYLVIDDNCFTNSYTPELLHRGGNYESSYSYMHQPKYKNFKIECFEEEMLSNYQRLYKQIVEYRTNKVLRPVLVLTETYGINSAALVFDHAIYIELSLSKIGQTNTIPFHITDVNDKRIKIERVNYENMFLGVLKCTG